MKKRLLCLLLCLVFVTGCLLTACGEKSTEEAVGDVNDEASKSTLTLGVHLVSEKEVSDLQVQKIEDAVNAITKTEFRVKLELHYYTMDEYYAVLENNIAAMRNQGTVSTETTTAGEDSEENTEAETVVNELGQTELKYPTIPDYQVDLFYLSGYDKYTEYSDAGYLARMEETVLRDIREVVTPQYLNAMSTLYKRIYALPTNAAIGEYTYLLVNKEMMKEMKKAESDFTSLTCSEVQDLLQYVDNYYRDSYVPLYATADLLSLTGVQYWGVDENGVLTDDFSLVGGVYDPSFVYKGENNYAPVGSLLQNSDYVEMLKTVKGYEFSGYLGSEEELANKSFAVGYMQGGAELVAEYGDEYAMIPVGVPKLTTEQLFSDMFAVYSGCSALERCMGILTYLNTNETIRNLLLYGIEGENYEMVNSKYLDEDGVPYKVVRRLNDSYVMDVNKTGNTLLAYTPEGENPLAKQYAMMQNLDAVADLALGFSMTYDGNTVDAEGLQTLRKCSKEIYDQIIACQTMEELEALLQEFVYASTSDDELRVALEQRDKSKKPTSSKGSSFAYIYYEWLEDNDIYVEED